MHRTSTHVSRTSLWKVVRWNLSENASKLQLPSFPDQTMFGSSPVIRNCTYRAVPVTSVTSAQAQIIRHRNTRGLEHC